MAPSTTRRARFFLSLGVLGLACLLLMGAVAFHARAAVWVEFGIALGALPLASVLLSDAVHRRELGPARELHVGPAAVRVWPLLTGAMVLVCAWEVTAAQAFGPPVARWVCFGSAWPLAALASVALVMHEISSERVVHTLQVIERHGGHPAS